MSDWRYDVCLSVLEGVRNIRGLFFFFKQKTAYEMRISDWSSDVCSSDLAGGFRLGPGDQHTHRVAPPSVAAVVQGVKKSGPIRRRSSAPASAPRPMPSPAAPSRSVYIRSVPAGRAMAARRRILPLSISASPAHVARQELGRATCEGR